MLGLSFLSRPGMIMPSSNDLRGLMPVLEKEKKLNNQTNKPLRACVVARAGSMKSCRAKRAALREESRMIIAAVGIGLWFASCNIL